MTLPTVVSLVILSGLCLSAGAAASTYRWVDDKGVVHYSDALPPDAGDVSHEVLDKEGRVIKRVMIRHLTAQEQARARAEAAKKEEARQEALERARYDRALLSTYSRADEIDLARDRALDLERLNIKGLQARMNDAAARLARINSSIEAQRKYGNAVSPDLLQTQNDAQEELAQLGAALRQHKDALASIAARYAADKQRWLELQKHLSQESTGN